MRFSVKASLTCTWPWTSSSSYIRKTMPLCYLSLTIRLQQSTENTCYRQGGRLWVRNKWLSHDVCSRRGSENLRSVNIHCIWALPSVEWSGGTTLGTVVRCCDTRGWSPGSPSPMDPWSGQPMSECYRKKERGSRRDCKVIEGGWMGRTRSVCNSGFGELIKGSKTSYLKKFNSFTWFMSSHSHSNQCQGIATVSQVLVTLISENTAGRCKYSLVYISVLHVSL